MLRAKSQDTLEVTPPATPLKKKIKKSNEPKGLKWFKGTPRSPKKLLKHAQKESSPQQIPIPDRVVEFDIDGNQDRLGVSEVLSLIDRKGSSYFTPYGSPDPALDTPTPSDPASRFSSTTPTTSHRTKGKCDKAKLKSNSKVNKPTSLKTISKLASNPNNNWSISENSESNTSCSLVNTLPEAKYRIMDNYEPRPASPLPNSYIRFMESHQEDLADEVEYDIDEEDCSWLELTNFKRQENRLTPVLPENMEFLMDRLEKESYFQMQSTGMDQTPLIDDDAVCCICMDGECQNSNAILFCDMCNLAVHQECYGVPYIPEGQWLCRRCLQSPSRAVDCALCPNKGGAFKQTDDGRWAHVICAIWIPEVCFANTVFLEPVDSVNNIPAARWRLCCYICKQKGVGACIQCHKSNCYTAFHVTCAQQANLCMRMDTVRESSCIIVKKTAYCDHHAPPEQEKKRKEHDESSPRQKLKQTRKLLAEKRCALPVVSIPTIPNDRVAQIATDMSFPRKHQFMKRLMSYWKLKRQLRNGVPLLRRLQVASLVQNTSTTEGGRQRSAAPVTTSIQYYRYWMRLRQDLEKARLLCELVRKREKMKRTQVHIRHQENTFTLTPINSILLNVVDEITARDNTDIFSAPVDTNEVVDYLLVIDQPMDLSTMKEKINSFEYSNIDDLEKDFILMIQNCLQYNSKDTVFYKAGIRLRELGGIVIRQARRLINSIGINPRTGMHLTRRSYDPPIFKDSDICEEVETVLESEQRFNLSFEKHIEKLQEVMDSTLALSHPLTRKKKFSRVRQELNRIRRLKSQKEAPCTFKQYIESRNVLLSDSDSVSVSSIPNLNLSHSRNAEPTKGRGFSCSALGKRRESLLVPKKPQPSDDPFTPNVPEMERSKARSLRPLKRKILLESPLKDSPVKESPVKESPVKESPVKESPVKESPVKESPLKEPALKNLSPIPISKTKEKDSNSPKSLNKGSRRSISKSPTRRSRRSSSTQGFSQLEIQPSSSLAVTPLKVKSSSLSPSKTNPKKDYTSPSLKNTVSNSVGAKSSAKNYLSKSPNTIKVQGNKKNNNNINSSPSKSTFPSIPSVSSSPSTSPSKSPKSNELKDHKKRSHADDESTKSKSSKKSKKAKSLSPPKEKSVSPRQQHPHNANSNTNSNNSPKKSAVVFSKKTLNNINNSSKKSGKSREHTNSSIKSTSSKSNNVNSNKVSPAKSTASNKSSPVCNKKNKKDEIVRKTRSKTPVSSSRSASSSPAKSVDCNNVVHKVATPKKKEIGLSTSFSNNKTTIKTNSLNYRPLDNSDFVVQVNPYIPLDYAEKMFGKSARLTEIKDSVDKIVLAQTSVSLKSVTSNNFNSENNTSLAIKSKNTVNNNKGINKKGKHAENNSNTNTSDESLCGIADDNDDDDELGHSEDEDDVETEDEDANKMPNGAVKTQASPPKGEHIESISKVPTQKSLEQLEAESIQEIISTQPPATNVNENQNQASHPPSQ